MGDIADMMTQGELCEDCGTTFSDDEWVYSMGNETLARYSRMKGLGIPLYHENCGPHSDKDLPKSRN